MVLQPPNIRDLDKWDGLFVTSTSRLMLCADRVVVEGVPEIKVEVARDKARAPSYPPPLFSLFTHTL